MLYKATIPHVKHRMFPTFRTSLFEDVLNDSCVSMVLADAKKEETCLLTEID